MLNVKETEYKKKLCENFNVNSLQAISSSNPQRIIERLTALDHSRVQYMPNLNDEDFFQKIYHRVNLNPQRTMQNVMGDDGKFPKLFKLDIENEAALMNLDKHFMKSLPSISLVRLMVRRMNDNVMMSNF
jgi:hypothetical protein